MTEPHQPAQAPGEEGSGQDETLAQSRDKAGESATPQEQPAEAEHDTNAEHAEAAHTDATHAEAAKAEAEPVVATHAGATGSEAEHAEAEHVDAEHADAEHVDAEHAEAEHADAEHAEVPGTPDDAQSKNKKGLLLGIGGGVLVLAIVALVIGAFAWPGFLAGPGKPDDKAAQVVAALASKNAGEVEKVSCHGLDGKVTTQIPPDALQLVQSAKLTGPAHLSIDTEALAPVDLTLSAKGQTKSAPVDVVLGVTNGDWCLKGIAQRQGQGQGQ